MKKLIQLFSLLACATLLQATATAQTYKVGDYYNDGTLEGVVFEVDASGKNGKIVHMKQYEEMFRPWCNEDSEQARLINANDRYDGRKNHEVVERIAGWQRKYPIFAWCRNLGDGWYLPAIEELKRFTLDITTYNAVNRTLKAKGATPLIDRTADYSWYWSSTESSEYTASLNQYSAYHVSLNQNCVITSYKSYPYFDVRAIACFGNAAQNNLAQPTDQPDYSTFEYNWASVSSAAEHGNVKAMCLMGDHYCWGEGVCDDYRGGENHKKAIEWYRRAADQNHPESLRKLGDMYYFARGVKGSDREALRWYEKAHQLGDAESTYKIGEIYKYGRNNDLPNDSNKALEYYLQAARRGNEDATFSVGLTLYHLDNGANREESYIWLSRDAMNGGTTAAKLLEKSGISRSQFAEYAARKTRLEGGTPATQTQATNTTRPTAQNTSSNDPASYTPQACYNKGKSLYDQNKYEEAIPWLERASEAKYRPAYIVLADCYNINGHSKSDPKKAWLSYARCTGGDGCNFNSRDYWYACYMLGLMFKSGRGCDKNYDSALHFLREFRKHTIPSNYATADNAINEVLALKRNATAPTQYQNNSTNSHATSPSHASSNVSSSDDMVARPGYGQLPNVVCMQNPENQYIVLKMNFFQNGGQLMMRCNKGAGLRIYLLDSDEQDLWAFQEANIGTGYGLNQIHYVPNRMGHRIVILKDWSRVGYQGITYFTRHITEQEFATCEEVFLKAVKNLNAMAETMGSGGGGGGSSVGPAQVQSGMSESYYRDMYDRYARMAESTYSTLTVTGYSITRNDKEESGGTLGSWSSSDYTTLKRDLREAQSNMRRIRSEASRAGYNIPASHWENVTVSY